MKLRNLLAAGFMVGLGVDGGSKMPQQALPETGAYKRQFALSVRENDLGVYTPRLNPIDYSPRDYSSDLRQRFPEDARIKKLVQGRCRK